MSLASESKLALAKWWAFAFEESPIRGSPSLQPAMLKVVEIAFMVQKFVVDARSLAPGPLLPSQILDPIPQVACAAPIGTSTSTDTRMIELEMAFMNPPTVGLSLEVEMNVFVDPFCGESLEADT
jgi:hypothetical protein